MRIDIMNCPVDVLSMEQTVAEVKKAVDTDKQIHHIVVNAAKLVKMKKDKQLHDSVVSADIINADGSSVVWLASKIGTPLPERVAGIDLMQNLVAESAKRGWKCFFLGAEEDVVKKVVETYSAQYGSDIIAGYRNGYFIEEDESDIAAQIESSRANVLFVAITSPKKENFLYRNKDKLSSVNFIMGVGGSFDVVAGKVKRAPLWMQKRGLEWLYRVIQEPGRMWKRYLVTNTLFIGYSFGEIIKAKFKR